MSVIFITILMQRFLQQRKIRFELHVVGLFLDIQFYNIDTLLMLTPSVVLRRLGVLNVAGVVHPRSPLHAFLHFFFEFLLIYG